MKIFIAGVVGLLVLVAVLVVGMRYAQVPTSSASVATSTLAEETDIYKIQVSYPTFGIAKADGQVKSIIDKAVSDFKALPPNPTPVSAKNELFGEYHSAYIGPDVMSAHVNIYQYSGGAHGGTVAYGLNFHPDGTAYTLDEALALIGKDLPQVSEEATKQLNERFGLVQFSEGATSTPANYQTFVIGKDSVKFIFQQYQVEAYAAGMPEIEFPRTK